MYVYAFSVWKWKYSYVRKAYCAITKEIASILPWSLLKNKMWISISSFRHVLVCPWFFSSASHEYRQERKTLRLFRQKALYSSWSLPLQPRWSECCGRHWRKLNKSSSRGRRHIRGRYDLSKTPKYQAIPLMVFYVVLPVTCQVLKTLSVTVSDVCVEIILPHRTLLFCL